MRGNLAVQRQSHTVAVPGVVRGIELAHLHPRPVIRAINEGAWWVKAEKRQRQPDAIQHRQRLLEQDSAFGFNHFRLSTACGRQGVAAIHQIEIQAQQGAVGRFTHEASTLGGVLRRQAKIKKLHATVRNQRDALFVVAKIYQHRITHLPS